MKKNSNKKLIETIVLMEVLKILRDEKSREARKAIYEDYLDSISQHKKPFRNQKIQKFVDKIKGDFDEIGFLMEHEFLDSNPFMELYSDVICRMWEILQDDIKIERKRRKTSSKSSKNDEFLQFFEKLSISAQKYRKKNRLAKPTIVDLRHKVKNL